MLVRLTSTALLVVALVLGVTGTAALIAQLPPIVMDIHRLAGWMLLGLIPFKALVIGRSIRRGIRRSAAQNVVVAISISLTGVTLLVLILPMLWLLGTRFLPELPGWRTVHLHWLIGFGFLIPLAVHVWQRWVGPRAADFHDRRAALAGLGVFGAASVLYAVLNRAGTRLLGLPELRPSTGSREERSFQGNDFPVTTNPGSGLVRIDAERWELTISGQVRRPLSLSLAQVLAIPPAQLSPILDCTIGWYSRQIWSGVPLADLLDLVEPLPPARYVSLIGVSGYRKDLVLSEARQILLATHVGGEPISHPHGAPLRAVVPTRRGWFWVKWLVEIQLRRNPTT